MGDKGPRLVLAPCGLEPGVLLPSWFWGPFTEAWGHWAQVVQGKGGGRTIAARPTGVTLTWSVFRRAKL